MNNNDFIAYQEKLDNKIRDIWSTPVFDGITNYDLYKKSAVKILWILKEPNKMDQNQSWNHREFHKAVNDYPRWRSTYQNIIRVSYGIIEEKYSFDDIPGVEDDTSFFHDLFILDEIALINVNKSGGGSVTDNEKLKQGCQNKEVKDFLFQQIEFINPNIIINAHHVYQFIVDQTDNKSMIVGKGCKCVNNNNRLIIDANHPNLHGHSTDKEYCNGILELVKENY